MAKKTRGMKEPWPGYREQAAQTLEIARRIALLAWELRRLGIKVPRQWARMHDDHSQA